MFDETERMLPLEFTKRIPNINVLRDFFSNKCNNLRILSDFYRLIVYSSKKRNEYQICKRRLIGKKEATKT